MRLSCHWSQWTCEGRPYALDAVAVLTNNVTVARKALAIVLSLAVQGAAIGAPLAHAHPDDHATDHHRGRAVHVHWTGHAHSHHPVGVPVLDDDDHDRAVFVNTFVSVAASALPAREVAHEIFELPIPAETTMHRPVEVAHGHDPPCCSSLPSRAPPASFLS
jgi:hypothetical protein